MAFRILCFNFNHIVILLSLVANTASLTQVMISSVEILFGN